MKKVHVRMQDVGVNGEGSMKRLDVGIEHGISDQQSVWGKGMHMSLCVIGEDQERYDTGSVRISIQEQAYTRLCVRFWWGLEAVSV